MRCILSFYRQKNIWNHANLGWMEALALHRRHESHVVLQLCLLRTRLFVRSSSTNRVRRLWIFFSVFNSASEKKILHWQKLQDIHVPIHLLATGQSPAGNTSTSTADTHASRHHLNVSPSPPCGGATHHSQNAEQKPNFSLSLSLLFVFFCFCCLIKEYKNVFVQMSCRVLK